VSLKHIRPCAFENLLKGLINLSCTIVSLEFAYFINSFFEIGIIQYHALLEHEFMISPIAADIEKASKRNTVQEEHKSFSSKFDSLVHRPTSVNQEDVLMKLGLHFEVFFFELKIF
jgi:hypothetical protein